MSVEVVIDGWQFLAAQLVWPELRDFYVTDRQP